MIISDKQVMQLMDYAHALLSKLCADHAPGECIVPLSNLLTEIAEQQSNELRTYENE